MAGGGRLWGPWLLQSTTVFTGVGNFSFANEEAVVVKKASGAATTVNLPAGPSLYQVVVVLDGKGDANANTITVQDPNSNTIDGAASYVIKANYAGAAFLWNGTEWNSIFQDNWSGPNLLVPGLFSESAADALTAHAGGGQASALALTAQVNRVTTVATAGDSVKLPASAPGLIVTVINAGANPMQVYGTGTDTINGVASATGVSQMQNSCVEYSCTVAGAWVAQGLASGFSGSFQTASAVNGLTAHAGGGQGSATPLTAMINRVTTVGSANDSVALPASAVGMEITAANAAAVNSMNVFPASGESINALSANAAFAVAAGKTATFYCTNAGQWHSILSA